MKFSEITESAWNELEPYLDTCLLPVTGMTGAEKPYEATRELERLRDIMDLVEIPFKGRVVTYPACHYGGTGTEGMIEGVCRSLKRSGFRFVIAITAKPIGQIEAGQADLLIAADETGALPAASDVSAAIQRLWQSARGNQAIS